MNVTNPCLTNGLVFNYTFSQIYSSCANASIATEVFGFALSPPSNFSEGQNATFLGAGDTEACRNKVQEVFDFYDCSLKENCDEEKYQPPRVNGTMVVGI